MDNRTAFNIFTALCVLLVSSTPSAFAAPKPIRRNPTLIAQTTAAPRPVVPGRVSTAGSDSVENLLQPKPAGKGSPSFYAEPDFIVTTTSVVENYRVIQYKGVVVGTSVREPTWSEDASAGLQEPYGGSLDSYVQMCEQARQQAFSSLVTRARESGANGIIGIHFDSQSFPLLKGHFATSVNCVGTAVVLKPKASR